MKTDLYCVLMMIQDIEVQETLLKTRMTVDEAFPVDCDVFLISKDVHYGASAKVLNSKLEKGMLQ